MEPKVVHLLSFTEATGRRLRKTVDCFGDPLAEEGDAAELKKVGGCGGGKSVWVLVSAFMNSIAKSTPPCR